MLRRPTIWAGDCAKKQIDESIDLLPPIGSVFSSIPVLFLDPPPICSSPRIRWLVEGAMPDSCIVTACSWMDEDSPRKPYIIYTF